VIKDLSKVSGINIKLESTGLTYDQNIFPVEPAIRLFEAAKGVYGASVAPEKELYYMYRYFEDVESADRFVAADLEYDITVINSGVVGEELIKTVGHYHGYVPGTNITYPEVYEAIEGEIEYLLQTRPDAEGNVDAVIVKARTGDKVVVPPNYGHVSVNVGSGVAISSNIQKRDLPASADYGSFEAYRGGSLYRKETGWVPNPAYSLRSTRTVRSKDIPEWGLVKNKSLYQSFLEAPEKFAFVSMPQNYDFSNVWEEINPL
jgi:glucose-6-phosphate isomerase, archaeal